MLRAHASGAARFHVEDDEETLNASHLPLLQSALTHWVEETLLRHGGFLNVDGAWHRQVNQSDQVTNRQGPNRFLLR